MHACSRRPPSFLCQSQMAAGAGEGTGGTHTLAEVLKNGDLVYTNVEKDPDLPWVKATAVFVSGYLMLGREFGDHEGELVTGAGFVEIAHARFGAGLPPVDALAVIKRDILLSDNTLGVKSLKTMLEELHEDLYDSDGASDVASDDESDVDDLVASLAAVDMAPSATTTPLKPKTTGIHPSIGSLRGTAVASPSDGLDRFYTNAKTASTLLTVLDDMLRRGDCASGSKIWEPCAGGGALAQPLMTWGGGAKVILSDIHPDPTIRGISVHDALDWSPPSFDLIVTNPPFSGGSRSAKSKPIVLLLDRFLKLGKPFLLLLPLKALAVGYMKKAMWQSSGARVYVLHGTSHNFEDILNNKTSRVDSMVWILFNVSPERALKSQPGLPAVEMVYLPAH